MRYFLYFWRTKLPIEGAIPIDDPENKWGLNNWIDIPDGEFEATIKKWSEKYSVMIKGPTDTFPHYRVYLDTGMFGQG